MENATDAQAYGLWGLVVLNSVMFIGFALGQIEFRLGAFQRVVLLGT